MAMLAATSTMEVIRAVPESIWETMLMKVPTDMSTADRVAMRLPYSRVRIWGRVVKPLL